MPASAICGDVLGRIAETWFSRWVAVTKKLRRAPLQVQDSSVEKAAVWRAGDCSRWTLQEVPVLFRCVSVDLLKCQLALNGAVDVASRDSVSVLHLHYSFGIWLKRSLQLAFFFFFFAQHYQLKGTDLPSKQSHQLYSIKFPLWICIAGNLSHYGRMASWRCGDWTTARVFHNQLPIKYQTLWWCKIPLFMVSSFPPEIREAAFDRTSIFSYFLFIYWKRDSA